MIKKWIVNRRKFSEQEQALALLIGGLIIALMFFGIAIFMIMNIVKIGTAILMIGVGVLALGAGITVLRKGWDGLRKGG